MKNSVVFWINSLNYCINNMKKSSAKERKMVTTNLICTKSCAEKEENIKRNGDDGR